MASRVAQPPYNPSMMPGIHQQVPPSYPHAPSPTQGGYPYPPQQQWQPPSYSSYGNTSLLASYGFTTLPPSATTVVLSEEVIIVGVCPACRIGALENYYGLAALCCAIVFFPAGIRCCLRMKKQKCSHCGVIID